ncbi:hypothetical protein DS891_06915 [Pseudoalteromonas sp. JC28]|uniref:hypothetical protein n=1 Tax=Pseudoalteromonas sp. JC28 TaxID=2267617 RepID=UPI001574D3D7|nr:hypothetical protein [Pseudoalteromonas sp. JC28]NSY33330.1 hypothetical protein [Pseudoalteromonas sp. JC28]
MKTKFIPAAIALAVSSMVAFNVNATEEESKTASIGSLILKKAKSKFVSNFGSLLGDALFGSQGPQFVSLSEESLQAIQDRVREEIVRDAEFDFIADFRSVESSMKHYSETISHKGKDLALLSSLLVKSNDIINHRALDSRYNADYYYMADTYALASSLAVAVYTERYLTGSVSKQSVSVFAGNLANKLETMLVAKKNADLPLRTRCDGRDPYDQDTTNYCRLVDPHGNTVFHDSYQGQREYYEWKDAADAAEAKYKEDKFQKIQSVINQLRNFR